MNPRFSTIVILFVMILICGCSARYGGLLVPGEPPDLPVQAVESSSSRALWGIWEIKFGFAGMNAEVKPLRNIQAHFNVTPMLQPPTCSDCVSIMVNSFDPVTRILDANVTLKNPWLITGYDVRGIIYTNDNGPALLNFDDWTGLIDIPEGYLINPFIAFAKGDDSRMFSGGTEHTENFLIHIPDPPQWPSILFAVDASWPGNCLEPYSIDNFSQQGILYNYTGSSATLQVEVKDWQGDVNEVTLAAPEITGEEFTQFSHFSGNQWLLNLTNKTGADAGTYKVRIKATSANSGDITLHDIVDVTISGGISENYPGDAGIENDPGVIFVEHFQENTLDALFDNWEEVKNPANMMFSDHVPTGSAGDQSLKVHHVGGDGTGAHLYRRLLPGYDQLFIRFYVKFDPDCGPIHHFFHAGGYNPSTPWPQGGAGEKPVGDERFTTGVEPFGNYDPWRWDFYTYWMEMHICPDENYWGNDFINDPELGVEMGTWICHELMMKMNDPVTDSNGEMALWINGQLRYVNGQCVSWLGEGFPNGGWIWDSFIPDPDGDPFGGFRWRSVEDLNMNFLWLLVYITQADPGHISEVWYDQVVVAHEYIGPMAPL